MAQEQSILQYLREHKFLKTLKRFHKELRKRGKSTSSVDAGLARENSDAQKSATVKGKSHEALQDPASGKSRKRKLSDDSSSVKLKKAKSQDNLNSSPVAEVNLPTTPASKRRKSESTGGLKRLESDNILNTVPFIDQSHTNSFALKAAQDLSKVRGKDFRKEMQKKKRSSWKGCGQIDLGVNSMRFVDSE